MPATAYSAAGEALPGAARNTSRAEAIARDQERVALFRKALKAKRKALVAKPAPRKLSDARWRETLIEGITRALAERQVVFTTTPGAIAAASGLSARQVGLIFLHHSDEVAAACAAAGVTIVEYHKKWSSGSGSKAARVGFTLKPMALQPLLES